MTIKASKIMQISYEFRTGGGGREYPTKRMEKLTQNSVPVEMLPMKLNLSREQFPSMAGFPIICMRAALGPQSPQAVCCEVDFALLEDFQNTNS